MEEIELGAGGLSIPVQIIIGGPGDGRSRAMKWVIGVLAEMTVGGASTFQAASVLPKPFLVSYVAIYLVLAVLDLALLVLLLCTSGGQSLTRFAERGAGVMMVLFLLLALILKAYTALNNSESPT